MFCVFYNSFLIAIS